MRATLLICFVLSVIYSVQADSWTLDDGSNLVLYGPSPMDSHSAVYYETTQGMVIFGGQNKGTLDPRRYYLKIDQDSWYSLPYSNVSFPRYSHTALLEGDAMIVFGGVQNDVPLSDVLVYNITTQIWLGTLTTTGSIPARYLHVAAFLNGYMYVHGGTPGSLYGSPFNDTWSLNPATKAWVHLTDAGPQRYGHTMVVTPSNTLLVFGGVQASNSAFMNDMHQFDGTSWTQVTPTGNTLPPARSRHSAVVINDGMFVYGGTYISGGVTTFYNDIWIFNFTTNTWNEQSPTGASSVLARAGHSAIVTSDKRMFVYGGYNSTGDVTNELAIYESPFYVVPTTTSTSTSTSTTSTTSTSSGTTSSGSNTGASTTSGSVTSSTSGSGTSGSTGSSTTDSPAGEATSIAASLTMLILCIVLLI